MADRRETVTNELIFELLKQMRETQLQHSRDLVEVKQRLGILAMPHASLWRRVDRSDERVERIERRLDLVEG
jgi:hypothetical protein